MFYFCKVDLSSNNIVLHFAKVEVFFSDIVFYFAKVDLSSNNIALHFTKMEFFFSDIVFYFGKVDLFFRSILFGRVETLPYGVERLIFFSDMVFLFGKIFFIGLMIGLVVW